MAAGWLDALLESLAREFGDRPRTATLATIGRDGAPRARTVICRGIEPGGMQVFVSDARSEKNFELRKRAEAEVVYWLPSQRVQFRLKGVAAVGGAGDDMTRRVEVWRDLSDATRAMFFWPPPGNVRVEGMGEFPDRVGPEVEPPESFELIMFLPMSVERLDLNVHPHDRRRWHTSGDAAELRLNP
jgi:PPOX class probable FMN-dependent enzyme